MIKENNNKNLEKNLKLISQEFNKSWEFQIYSLNVIHTKANWITAIDIGLIVLILNKEFQRCLSLMIAVFLIISLLFSIAIYWLQEIKRGGNLDQMSEAKNRNSSELLDAINTKKKEAINLNNLKIQKLKIYLKLSIIFLIIGIFLIFINLFFNNFNVTKFNYDKDSNPKETQDQPIFDDSFDSQELGENIDNIEKK